MSGLDGGVTSMRSVKYSLHYSADAGVLDASPMPCENEKDQQ